MASDFLKYLTPEQQAALKTGTIEKSAYLAALKKLSMAGVVEADAVQADHPDGVPAYVKSVNIAGSGHAALDGTYLEAKSVAMWMEQKNAQLIAELNKSTAMVKHLTNALNTATNAVAGMNAASKHEPHTIVTDIGHVFSDDNMQSFKVPPLVYVSASPGGKCFEAAVHVVETHTMDYNNTLGVKLALQATTPLSGWWAPINNPVGYDHGWPPSKSGLFAGNPGKVKAIWEKEHNYTPPWEPAKVSFSPAEASLGAHEPKKPKVTLQPEKWLPPTVKSKGGEHKLSPAAQAKNEIAAKKANTADANLYGGFGSIAKEKVDNALEQHAKGVLSPDQLDEILTAAGIFNAGVPGAHHEQPIAEKWIPDGYKAVHVIGQKEPQLVKIKK